MTTWRALLPTLVAGCAATTATPEVSVAPAPAPVRPVPAPRAEKPPLLPVEIPTASPELFADVVARVEGAMTHAHGVARTAQSFVAPPLDESIGQVGWSSREVMFAVGEDVIGTIDREVPCGAEALRLSWRTLPVGRAWVGTKLDERPQWWRLGDAWVRVGATELVGLAVDARAEGDCAVWGVLVEGLSRADAEFKSPGSSGPTDGVTVNVFGADATLVVAATGVTLGADPPIVQITPTFAATCAHVRWAGDLLGTRTLRARFSNGPQQDGCPGGDTSEEFAHSRGPGGDVSRTQRVRVEPTGSEREDTVVRTIGAGRLVWEAISSTTSFVEESCETTVERHTGRWTVRHPTKPERSAVGHRTRTDTTCAGSMEIRETGGTMKE